MSPCWFLWEAEDMYKLSNRSKNKLQGVHPDLIKVVKRAIQICKVDFGVSEGLRSFKRQKIAFKSGYSKTMNSRHLQQKDGYSHAVDLFVLVEGKINWQHKHFRYVIQAMMTAAIESGVQIRAGGLWRDFVDSPHFELNRSYYLARSPSLRT